LVQPGKTNYVDKSEKRWLLNQIALIHRKSKLSLFITTIKGVSINNTCKWEQDGQGQMDLGAKGTHFSSKPLRTGRAKFAGFQPAFGYCCPDQWATAGSSVPIFSPRI